LSGTNEVPVAPMVSRSNGLGRRTAGFERLAIAVRPIDLAVGLAIGLMTWPVAELAPSAAIDPSWIVGLHLAARQGLNFGNDILFTYGPLGFLGYPQPYLAWTSALALAFVGAVHVTACIWMFHLARQAIGSVAAFVLVLGTAFVFPWIAGWTLYGILIFMACATAVLRRQEHPSGAVFAAVIGAAVGLASLGKLNIAFVSLAIGAVGVVASARDPRRSTLTFAVSAAAVFLTLWVATGQQAGDLLGYARGALEVSAGYGASMGQLDPQSSWMSGVDALATFILIGVVCLRSSDLARRDRLVLWLLVAGMIFAAFKGGFTRQGTGMVIYLVTLLAIWPVVIPRKMHPVAVAMPVAGMLALVLALTTLPIGALMDPGSRLQALVNETSVVLFTRHATALTNGASLRNQIGLPPEATALLRGETVDIHPWQTAVAHAYPEFTWRPQPIFQDYSAYTPYLDRQNADFLASTTAPSRILWMTGPDPLSIDGRSLWFDSPMAKIQMVCRYLPLATGPTWQVLGRVADRCGTPVVVRSVTGVAGEPIPLPTGLPAGILTVRISGMGQDPLSQLVTLAYRSPPWWLNEGASAYRIPLGINGEPTILAATTDVGYQGALTPPAPPATVTIGPDPGAPGDHSPLTVVFEIVPIRQQP
jgi:hypothetical protein